MAKLTILQKIRNESWVNISINDLYQLEVLGFNVLQGTKHYKLFHLKLVNSNTKFKSGTITVNLHKKDKKRLDFNATQDLKSALIYLKILE